MDREQQVSRLYIDLADTLVSDYEVADLLQRLVDGVQQVLGVTAVGVARSSSRPSTAGS